MDRLNDLLGSNEKLIDRFNLDYYFSTKKYDVVAAIKALNNSNMIQKSYFKLTNNLDVCDHILKLYALLQSLFVAIDSLYALTYGIVKTKSFININNNKKLRELKYIRNDVVGHPSNRLIKENVIAYAILDDESITDDSFSYKIYTQDEIIKKDVIIRDLIISYYEEANYLLDELYKMSNNDIKLDDLKNKIINVLDRFNKNKDYLELLDDFIAEYKNKYLVIDNKNRIIWRSNLVKKLSKLESMDKKISEVINYATKLEIVKIYEQILNVRYKDEYNIPLPEYIGNTYRFFNRNRHLVNYISYLTNVDNPLFLNTVEYLRKEAYKVNNSIYKYFDLIIKYYNEDLEIAYALCLPIKNYKAK